MIVCSCNLLTDTAIREALARPNAPEAVRDLYAALGVKPKCGGCAKSINRLIDEAKAIGELAGDADDRRDAA